ncbi:MAG: hypothetical protein WBA87_03215 [Microbacterium sp.]
MWRKRFATAADPFPSPVGTKAGRAYFDAVMVAQWLTRTEHGNNADAIADAAASASPDDFDVADSSHVSAVDALLTVRAASGEAVSDLTKDELHRQALAIDPDDACLVSETLSANPSWKEWADLLADAAYSPLQASLLLEQRHRAFQSSSGSSSRLTAEGDALLVSLATALATGRQAHLVISSGITPSLTGELAAKLTHDTELVVTASSEARAIRRRILCDGGPVPRADSLTESPRVFLLRLALDDTSNAATMLNALDEVALEMRDHDRAIVIGPAAALVDSVSRSESLSRTDVLRSGRVRAIAKLPTGLVVAAPRETLAIWVLGREASNIPIADRFTAVADLTDVTLTKASQADLTSDVLAAMGDDRDIRAHSFRFTRLVRTTALLTAAGSLVPRNNASSIAVESPDDVPALLDQALDALGQDAPSIVPTVSASAPVPSEHITALIAGRHLRMLSGTRIPSEELATSGLVVVSANDLDVPSSIGHRHVDSLTFATLHPSAVLTVAGDVVFRTAPTAKAWVDAEGSKVVAYPARVLRIDRADPGGLVPELIAADINQSAGGPGAWRRWKLRRVTPQLTEPLRTSLTELAACREALTRRVDALDAYAELLTAGITSGAVTLTNPDAVAASDPQ